LLLEQFNLTLYLEKMLSIISSAKSLDFNTPVPTKLGEEPIFYSNQIQLLQLCKDLSKDGLKKLMNISDALAGLNYQRFQHFEEQPRKQAIFAYDGDVYDYIERYSFTPSQIDFMQTHIGIMSGLYGFLRPLDYIKPYRLEMAIKLNGMTLSSFWNSIITNHINETLVHHQNKYLINLASVEYSSAIAHNILKNPIINIYFKENRNDQLKTIGLNAKKARGMMANFIIKNSIDTPEGLKSFTEGNYAFSALASSDSDWVFIK